MPRTKTPAAIEMLLAALDDAYHTNGWHGPTLRGAIRRVDAEEAVWRPKSVAHSIAEITLHCAYWKYAGMRRLTGAKRGGFPIKGSNWFVIGADSSASQWKDIVKLLDDMHASLREAVAALPANRLNAVTTGAKVTNLKLIHGLAAHDAYHTGQIRMIRGQYGKR